MVSFNTETFKLWYRSVIIDFIKLDLAIVTFRNRLKIVVLKECLN